MIDNPDVFFGDDLLDEAATRSDGTEIRVIIEETPDPSLGGSSLSSQPGRHATVRVRASEWAAPAYNAAVTVEDGTVWRVKHIQREGGAWVLSCTAEGSVRRST